MDNEKIQELEKRLKVLEEKLSKIDFSEAKEVTMTHCPVGEIYLREECTLSIQHCPIGSVIDGDLDDAEERLDELEDRLDELTDGLDDFEDKLDVLSDAEEDLGEASGGGGR